MVRRKTIWLMILMIWIGMVTSIIFYQGNNYLALEEVSTRRVDLVDNGQTTITGDEILISESEYSLIEEEGLRSNQELSDINITRSESSESGEDFFVEYRLERDKARSEQVNIYRELINNP